MRCLTLLRYHFRHISMPPRHCLFVSCLHAADFLFTPGWQAFEFYFDAAILFFRCHDIFRLIIFALAVYFAASFRR